MDFFVGHGAKLIQEFGERSMDIQPIRPDVVRQYLDLSIPSAKKSFIFLYAIRDGFASELPHGSVDAAVGAAFSAAMADPEIAVFFFIGVLMCVRHVPEPDSEIAKEQIDAIQILRRDISAFEIPAESGRTDLRQAAQDDQLALISLEFLDAHPAFLFPALFEGAGDEEDMIRHQRVFGDLTAIGPEIVLQP